MMLRPLSLWRQEGCDLSGGDACAAIENMLIAARASASDRAGWIRKISFTDPERYTRVMIRKDTMSITEWLSDMHREYHANPPGKRTKILSCDKINRFCEHSLEYRNADERLLMVHSRNPFPSGIAQPLHDRLS